MSTPKQLDQLLQSLSFQQHHSVPVGREFEIEMPHDPMTGETEFVELRADLTGVGQELQISQGDTLEGRLLPRTMHVRAIKPGHGVIKIAAHDALSQQLIEGVQALEIVVDVEDS